jgi:hypothetical protein
MAGGSNDDDKHTPSSRRGGGGGLRAGGYLVLGAAAVLTIVFTLKVRDRLLGNDDEESGQARVIVRLRGCDVLKCISSSRKSERRKEKDRV